MAELLKNVYSVSFFDKLTSSIVEVLPEFDREGFLESIFNKEWKEKELKERMRHVTLTLNKYLTNDFEKDVEFLLELIPVLKGNGFGSDHLAFIFLPDYIEVYGIDYYDRSVSAMEEITQFITCEFAVRPFFLKYYQQMTQQMLQWALHENLHVRRLASEGIRPRLPWAMAVPVLKTKPEPIFPILEHLKDDSSEYVRRSVANNLNDISKDHPAEVIALIKSWDKDTKERQKLIKHAARTLLKQGNQEVMSLFGFGAVDQIQVDNLTVKTPLVSVGEYLEFEFEVINNNQSHSKIRLEYAIYFLKANGTWSKKVFKISEKNYPANSNTIVNKKQSFKPITTRKYYEGKHEVSVIINGVEFQKLAFRLTT
ncbi:MAG: DNA alkylation repair protein [Flavobacteriales bacterium]|jgi:3-methyladenine DNA glycosylase AlkC|nr:DNA alkylation repair protein [Flavobacteriales bacterium]